MSKSSHHLDSHVTYVHSHVATRKERRPREVWNVKALSDVYEAPVSTHAGAPHSVMMRYDACSPRYYCVRVHVPMGPWAMEVHALYMYRVCHYIWQVGPVASTISPYVATVA